MTSKTDQQNQPNTEKPKHTSKRPAYISTYLREDEISKNGDKETVIPIVNQERSRQLESITLPRIFFQSKNLAKEFNQKRYLNTVGKWVKYLPDDPRISIEVLADALFVMVLGNQNQRQYLRTFALPEPRIDKQSRRLGKRAYTRIPRGIVSANNGSLNNYYHWSIQTMPSIALTRRYFKEGFKLILRKGLNRYQKEWLSLLDIDINSNQIFRIKRREIVHAKELIVPLTL